MLRFEEEVGDIDEIKKCKVVSVDITYFILWQFSYYHGSRYVECNFVTTSDIHSCEDSGLGKSSIYFTPNTKVIMRLEMCQTVKRRYRGFIS